MLHTLPMPCKLPHLQPFASRTHSRRSKVYATDLWVSAFKANPMDKTAGLKYRQLVLQPGGSQPELKSLTNFLGREPNDEAYYSEISSSPDTQGLNATHPSALL